MRGLILAGGSGSRLWPVTLAVSKQLIPVYDKPLIYYPLSTLLSAGIKDILIIAAPQATPQFQQLLGDGGKWGVNFSYAVQPTSAGLAQAFILGSEFIGNQSSALALGDNIFYGHRLTDSLQKAAALKKGARVFAYPVSDPARHGVVAFDESGQACDLEEKPKAPKSKYAVTGLYFYDSTAAQRARSLKPSARGELEITDLNQTYLDDGRLSVEVLPRGITWLDAGTHDALLDAAMLVRTIEKRQGVKVGCPEEICWRLGHIDDGQLENLADELKMNDYGKYLKKLVDGTDDAHGQGE